MTNRKIKFLLLFVIFSSSIFAQENEDCMMCHNDKELSKKSGNRIVSLFVDEGKIKNSVHKEIKCVNCHSDLKEAEFPHESDLKKVNCGQCHPDQNNQFWLSLHGKAKSKGDPLAPDCKVCHSTHQILDSKNLNSQTNPLKVPFLCGQCHREG
ncbi:MAG: hypothetical protein ACK4G1_07085, partial [Ignavibacteria bacterium]